MGRITASFRASLAPSRPATSLHRTLGFSIMMAPMRRQLCSRAPQRWAPCSQHLPRARRARPPVPVPPHTSTPPTPLPLSTKARLGATKPQQHASGLQSHHLSPSPQPPLTMATQESLHPPRRQPPQPCPPQPLTHQLLLQLLLLGVLALAVTVTPGERGHGSGTAPGPVWQQGPASSAIRRGGSLMPPRTPCCHSGTP